MADDTQTVQTGTTTATGTVASDGTTGGASAGTAKSQSGGGAVVSDDGIVVDKNKTQEQYMQEAEAKYIVPSLVRDKFPDLVKLIYETESMNAEEREYWMQIMPIMTEDQIVKFREILVNEKEQLSKLDQEYENEVSRINKTKAAPIDEEKLKEKLADIEKAEKAKEVEEEAKEAALLEQLDKMDNA